MSYNTELFALVVENVYFRYTSNPFKEESLEILENLLSTISLEEIHISWVEAWEADAGRGERRGAWRQYIQRNNAREYEELIQKLGEESKGRI